MHSKSSGPEERSDEQHTMGTLKAFFDGLVKVIANPRRMAVLFVIFGALLFLPHSILAKLYLDSIANQYRPWFAVGFLFFLAMTCSYPIESGWRWSTNAILSKVYRKRRIARLHALDANEKRILIRYIQGNKRSDYFDSYNATVLGLIHARILYFGAKWIPIHKAPVIISEWAWEYLHEHPELLSLDGTPPPISHAWMAH